jgi:hypothetical protein
MALCAGIAGYLCLLLADVSARWVGPLLFLLAVIPIAHLWGTKTGILGAALAGLIFAVFLFPPIGSLAVQNAADRIILISFQLCAFGVAYLSRVEATGRDVSFSPDRADRNVRCFQSNVAGPADRLGEVDSPDWDRPFPARVFPGPDQSTGSDEGRLVSRPFAEP